MKNFKDFLAELSQKTKEFETLTEQDRVVILEYILKNSSFLSYLKEEESKNLSLYILAFINNYDFAFRCDLTTQKLFEECKENLNNILFDILRVMENRTIYDATINSFCYGVEERLILNANEYLSYLFSKVFNAMEDDLGDIYKSFGKAVSQNENLESLKACILTEELIYRLMDAGYEKPEDIKFFDRVLANYNKDWAKTIKE